MKVKEATGNTVGVGTSWNALHTDLEIGISGIKVRFRATDDYTSGPTWETSVIKELSERRCSETSYGHVAVFHFPQEIMNDSRKLYWISLNIGSYLTGNPKEAGNAMHLACSSIASASWDFAESPTEENKVNFLSTVGWSSKFFDYMMKPDAKPFWKESRDCLELLLKQTSSDNILRPISAMVVLGSMGRPIDKWSLLCKIMISVGRTFHDCGKSLVTPDALGRVFVYMVLLDLLGGVPLETVVTASKRAFITKFSSLKSDNKNLRVVTVVVSKIFTKTSPEVCETISNKLLHLIEPHKLSTLSMTDVTSILEESVVVEGDMITPLNRNAGSWQTDRNTNVLAQTEEMIKTRFVNSEWGVTGYVIPSEAISGRLDIYGEYTGGTGGNPGVRTFSGPTLEWRKKGFQGLTSNGGRGDGFGAPTPLDGTCKVNLNGFRSMKPLLTITFVKKGYAFDVMAKFEGWSKFHRIHYTNGSKILIASKGFALEVKTSDICYSGGEAEDVDGPVIGGTTLASMTSGLSLASELGEV